MTIIHFGSLLCIHTEFVLGSPDREAGRNPCELYIRDVQQWLDSEYDYDTYLLVIV